mgnify:CR=1 FL=1
MIRSAHSLKITSARSHRDFRNREAVLFPPELCGDFSRSHRDFRNREAATWRCFQFCSSKRAVTATSGIVRRDCAGVRVPLFRSRSHRDFRNREAEEKWGCTAGIGTRAVTATSGIVRRLARSSCAAAIFRAVTATSGIVRRIIVKTHKTDTDDAQSPRLQES